MATVIDTVPRLYIGYLPDADFYRAAFCTPAKDGALQTDMDAMLQGDSIKDIIRQAVAEKNIGFYITETEPTIPEKDCAFQYFTSHAYQPLNTFQLREAKSLMRKVREIVAPSFYRKAHKPARAPATV